MARIHKQFGSLSNFNDNVENLTKQVEKLESINLKAKQWVEASRKKRMQQTSIQMLKGGYQMKLKVLITWIDANVADTLTS